MVRKDLDLTLALQAHAIQHWLQIKFLMFEVALSFICLLEFFLRINSFKVLLSLQ